MNLKFAIIPLLAVLGLNCAKVAAANAADDVSAMTVEKLIGHLALIDSQAPGLHGTASVVGFTAEDKPLKFGGGVLGSPAPKTPPQMRELTRRGASALPQLISHLDDTRPTKLTVGNDFFMFRFFSDEYDPKVRPPGKQSGSTKHLVKSFDGGYTVKVGDVCYAIIGQIVNRSLTPVRYQPTAGLVINSPIEAPVLVGLVKKDWGVDVAGHKASLIADAQRDEYLRDNTGGAFAALVRLRFYYPDDYKRLKEGDLKQRIAQFEADEKKH